MKIGDYVRNEYGIAKIIDIVNNGQFDIIIFDKEICYFVNKQTNEKDTTHPLIDRLPLTKEIDINKLKHNSNILYLLEDGDIIHYHNEYIDFISPVLVYDDGEIASNLYDSDGCIFLDKEEDKCNIKSIVTKEQFESMKYRIGE